MGKYTSIKIATGNTITVGQPIGVSLNKTQGTLEKDIKYTLQFKIINHSSINTLDYIYVGNQKLSSINISQGTTVDTINGKDMKLCSVEFTATSKTTNPIVKIGRLLVSGDIKNTLLYEVTDFQLERGYLTNYSANANDLQIMKTNLESKINQLADSLQFMVSKNDYDNLGDMVSSALGQIDVTTGEISLKVEQSDIDKASNALKNEIKTELDGVNERIDGILDNVGGAIADGIIDEAETIIINNSVTQLNKEKETLSQRYDYIYKLVDLSSSMKSSLKSVMDTYNTKSTNLINHIKDMITDKTISSSERTTYDSLLTEYSTALGNVNKKIEECINSLSSNRVDSAKAEIKITTDAISQNVTNLSKTVETKADGSTVSTLSSKVGTLETSVNGISGRVSSVETANTTMIQNITKAQQDATKGINDAKSASDKATSAQTTANAAKSTADNNKASIGTLTTEVSNVKSNVATLDVNLSGITQRVSSTESTLTTTTTKIDSLEIGGRNLLLNTSTSKTMTGSNTTNQCVSIYNFIPSKSDLNNQELTISFTYTVSNYTGGHFKIQAYSTVYNNWSSITPTGNGTFTFKGTMTTSSNFSSNNGVQVRMDNFNGTLVVSKMKIEKGNKATDWTPAPEDIDASISNVDSKVQTTNNKVASIETNLNGITQRVSSTESTVSSHTTQLGTVDTRINNAKNSAISTASSDATTKANNALASAKTDATTKANNALADAKTYTNGQITTVNTTINNKVAEIKATTDAITQRVSSTEATTTTLTTKVNTAQSTADSKNKVFRSTPTVPYKVGDLWMQGSTGDILVCKTARSSGSYSRDDWGKDNKYTDDTKANAVDSKVTTLTTTVNTTNSKVATLETNLSSITQRVSATESTTTTLNTKVNNAQSTADSATTKANNAQNTANTANSTANSNKTNISNLTTRVSTAESKLTKDSLTTTIGSHYTTSSDVNGIVTSKGYATTSQVQQTTDTLTAKFSSSGGYNLLRNTGFLNGTSQWGTNATITVDTSKKYSTNNSLKLVSTGATGNVWRGFNQKFAQNIPSGKSYTATLYYRVEDKSTFNSSFTLELKGLKKGATSETALKSVGVTSANMSNGHWKKLTLTATTSEQWDYLYVYPWIQQNGTVWITDIIVTEGELETPWSPHPSEIYDGITKIDKDGITVTQSNAKTKTTMSADGFAITRTDKNADIFKVGSNGLLTLNGVFKCYKDDANMTGARLEASGAIMSGYNSTGGSNPVFASGLWTDENMGYFSVGYTNALYTDANGCLWMSPQHGNAGARLTFTRLVNDSILGTNLYFQKDGAIDFNTTLRGANDTDDTYTYRFDSGVSTKALRCNNLRTHNIYPRNTGSHDIGSASMRYKDIFGDSLSTTNNQLRLGTVTSSGTWQTYGALDINSKDGYVFPDKGTGQLSLGTSSKRFHTIFLVNSPNVSSDKRLKTDIHYLEEPMPEEPTIIDGRVERNMKITTKDMYDFVKDDLKLASYRYNVNLERGITTTDYGFIAQDVLYTKVGSEIVQIDDKEDVDSTLSYNQGNYIATLAGALQEAINKIEVLEKKVQELESKLV